MRKGIDVSSHNGKLDWSKLKSQGVEFALIRIGYGSDIKSQDDNYANYNMSECERLGIPYGVYIYSYALSHKDVESEVDHTLRMIKGHKVELGVYFDMEDADAYKAKNGINVYKSQNLLTEFCVKFCEAIERAGYNAGVYANYDYFKNVLDINRLDKWSIWLAQWRVSKPAIKCDVWQYTSDETFNGVVGRFDANYLYTYVEDKSQTQAEKKSTSEVAQEVIDGKWGNGEDRKAKLTAAGYDYNEVQTRVNELMAKINENYYTVKRGDTLTSIAKKFNTTVDKLVKLNGLNNPDLIYPNEVLKIK